MAPKKKSVDVNTFVHFNTYENVEVVKILQQQVIIIEI